MRFIYFFLIVLLVFALIFSLLWLMIKYLNKPESRQTKIEYGQLNNLEGNSLWDKIKRLYNEGIDYFDKELIRYDEANEKLKSNYFDYIVDVRTNNEWEKGHYPTATHIPIEPQEKFKKDIDYYNRKLKFLVYCKSGRRAKIASDIMKKMGFEDVRYLIGSYQRLEIYKEKNELMDPN